METKKWDDRVAKERDERLIQDVYDAIEKHEGGKIKHGYACTEGRITFGPGLMVSDREEMKNITLYHKDGKIIATFEEKKKEYDAIKDRRDALGKTPGDKPYNHAAHKYKVYTNLIILDGKNQALNHMRDDIKSLRNKFKGKFDSFPREVQMVLLDMEYNMGGRFHNGSAENVGTTGGKGYPNFFKAIESGNWKWAAQECTSPMIQKSRNEWRKTMLNSVK